MKTRLFRLETDAGAIVHDGAMPATLSGPPQSIVWAGRVFALHAVPAGAHRVVYREQVAWFAPAVASAQRPADRRISGRWPRPGPVARRGA